MQINESAVKIADSQLCFKVPTTHPYLHERHALTVASLYVKGLNANVPNLNWSWKFKWCNACSC